MWPSSVATISLFVLFSLVHLSATDKPNIVIILADDMGFNDVGFRGGDVKTPNIDALAGHGVILNRHYSEVSCTPSRAALLTGRYPSRIGMQGRPLPAGWPRGLSTSVKLFPQYFRDLGYKTHLIGKWHLGYETWDHMPTRRGFDTFFGYLNGLVGYYDMVHSQSGYSGRDFWRNEEHVWGELYGKYMTTSLTEEALAVIKRHEGDGGLLLFLNHLGPHLGNLGLVKEAPPGLGLNLTHRQVYAEMMRHVDDSVGAVMQSLNDKGVLNNSIVIFMSDNGAPTVDPLWNYANHGSNWPLRGVKMSLHDGGVRTAAVVWSPEFKSGSIYNELFHVTDWLPTLYSAAGGEELMSTDGVDQWANLLTADSAGDPPRTEALIGLDEEYQVEAYLSRNWKLVKNYNADAPFNFVDGYYGESGRGTPYNPLETAFSTVGSILGKPHTPYEKTRELVTIPTEVVCLEESPANCSQRHCLYDILADPTECRDLSSQRPDVVARLRAALEQQAALMSRKSVVGFDPAADPALRSDFWGPWISQPSSAPGISSSSVFLIFLVVSVYSALSG